MTTYAIKNWKQFQHYNKRRPPWIKLYRTLLDDAVFMQLPDASRAIAPCLWLLASETPEGTITDDMVNLTYRLHQTPEWITAALEPLISKGFLIDASNVLATCQQHATPETETEKRQSVPRKYKKREIQLIEATIPA